MLNAASELRAVLPEELTARLYIGCVAETPADDLYHLFDKLGPDAKEAYVTTAEMLRAEGRTKGLAEMVVKQLTVKFGPLPDAALARVQAATAEQLETWAVRVLTAETLDQVLH